uniref:Uncharacterized protein n=1 Tax=Chenopodium quinoa TaxID=63459 RepID=A0A803MHR1_CHEQI
MAAYEGKEKKLEGMKDEDWNLLDRQALGVIRLTLSRNVAFNIAKEKTTTDSWNATVTVVSSSSRSNKLKFDDVCDLCRSTPKNQEVKAEANVTSTVEGDDALICSLESKEESWVLASGASFHATSKK